MLSLLRAETAHAITRLAADKIYPPQLIQQSVQRFLVSPEGVGWIQHMEQLLYQAARMGESQLLYSVYERQRHNDVLHDPLCPLYSWYQDVVRKLELADVVIFERPTTCVIRNDWRQRSLEGKMLGAQLDTYMVRGLQRLVDAWNEFADVPAKLVGYNLLFEWSE